MSTYTDREMTCVECNQGFTFSVEDQEYHAKMGFQNDPKRCSSCRSARRASSGGGGGGPRGGGGGQREFHTAVCADCGNEARVPFKPRGDKPVYCSNCFGKHR